MSEKLTTSMLSIGILTVSDSCSENRAEDRSGTNLCRLIREENLINGSVAVREIVSDDADKIKNKLMDWSDVKKLNLILTTGGTGFSQRDVTPEATKAILEKEAIGITIAMITQSLQVTKLAMLSRLVCGSRGQSLIINLPGSVKGSEECFRFALPGITHAVDLLKDNSSQIKETHTHLQSKGVHQDTKQLKEKRHLDIASSVLQKYSKQFPKPRKKKSKHQRKFIGVMVRHSLKENERIQANFDDCNHRNIVEQHIVDQPTVEQPTVEQTYPEEEQNMNSQIYEAVKISSPPKTNFERENSIDFVNTESLDLPEIENIPSVEEAEIQLIQKMYCDQVNKQSGFSNSADISNQSEQHPHLVLNGLVMDINNLNQTSNHIESNESVVSHLNQLSNQIVLDESMIVSNVVQPSSNLTILNESVIDGNNMNHLSTNQNILNDSMIIHDAQGIPSIEIQQKHLSWSNGIESMGNSDSILYIDEILDENVNNIDDNADDNADGNSNDDLVCQESVGVQADLSDSNEMVHYSESEDENPVKKDISIYDMDSDSLTDKITLPKSYRKMGEFKLKSVPSRPFSSFSTAKNQQGAFKRNEQHGIIKTTEQDGVFKKPLNNTKLSKRKGCVETVKCEVGKGIHKFFAKHHKIRGIYLNKGKRHVKKDLVVLKRQDSAVDQGSWKRGNFIHDRNRLDDYFELTEEGQRKRTMLDKKMIRDEYVVNWYLFCPGHGNCKRNCGGYGKCIQGCKGMAHKQDRHNCSVMVNMKLYLSNLNHWQIQVKGDHVEDGVLWTLPPGQRINEVTRDQIISTYSSEKPEDPEEGIIKILPFDNERKRYSRYMASMKRRRKMKTYNARNEFENLEQDQANSDSIEPSALRDNAEVNVSHVYTYTTHKLADSVGPITDIVSPQCLSQETIIYAETPSISNNYQYTII
ncbi:uncharacterized protein LOC134712149 isoform X2 [Mytilus trossulus]|uniref:uncharacterized protein LOC134712149 isoform X2 n=1 Tax=Mytilus trossulus TaxID=6551 RepID=UPI0030061FFC